MNNRHRMASLSLVIAAALAPSLIAQDYTAGGYPGQGVPGQFVQGQIVQGQAHPGVAGQAYPGSGYPTAEYCPPEAMTWSQSFHYDYYRNKMWPMPFRAMDSKAVLRAFEVQRNNGWKLNNTLGTSMFDPETQQLTDSGRAQVKWILTRAPQDRRVVFVLEASEQPMTAARVESVQLAISQLVPVGPLPQLYLTDQEAAGSSGIYQTAIVRAMNDSVPAPRLIGTGTP